MHRADGGTVAWAQRLLVACGLAALLLATCALPAGAVPDLQLYVEGATWDGSTETWVTTASDFDLWVIVANNSLAGIKVAAALDQTADPASGSVTLTSPWETKTYTGDTGPYAFTWGTPKMAAGTPLKDLPNHGEYPTNFGEVLVGDIGPAFDNPDPWDTVVYDMQPGGTGSAWGTVKPVHVSISGFEYVHFDAYNHTVVGKTKVRFAPFSHDAEHVPEPGSLLLMGSGLFGLLGMGLKGRWGRMKQVR